MADGGTSIKKQRLAKLPITLFCIHGNHEMRPGTLLCYHTTEWNDGQVYVEDTYPNLLFAIDGEVYNLGDIPLSCGKPVGSSRLFFTLMRTNGEQSDI